MCIWEGMTTTIKRKKQKNKKIKKEVMTACKLENSVLRQFSNFSTFFPLSYVYMMCCKLEEWRSIIFLICSVAHIVNWFNSYYCGIIMIFIRSFCWLSHLGTKFREHIICVNVVSRVWNPRYEILNDVLSFCFICFTYWPPERLLHYAIHFKFISRR